MAVHSAKSVLHIPITQKWSLSCFNRVNPPLEVDVSSDDGGRVLSFGRLGPIEYHLPEFALHVCQSRSHLDSQSEEKQENRRARWSCATLDDIVVPKKAIIASTDKPQESGDHPQSGLQSKCRRRIRKKNTRAQV